MSSAPLNIRCRPCHEETLRALSDFPSLLRRVYAARGVRGPDELELGLKSLLPFTALKGIASAVAVLQHALQTQQHILIIGDFDADGATSTALALRALRAMGAARVDYMVPNRFAFGYGLSKEIVAAAGARNPDLIITVDNGISSVEGVAYAKQLGIEVIVTDHHLAGSELPAAAAIVNPNQPGCDFASKNLAGVGVIFYLLTALRATLREQGWFGVQGIAEPNMAQFLDLVALGTVADVVPLDYNNRILVAQGLQRIAAGKGCLGIQALLQIAGRDGRRIRAADLGFALGPRLNAAGRLDDMALGIECLLAEDYQQALSYASTLDALNRDRKEIEAGMQAQALELLEPIEVASEQAGLCLYHPDWHQGVVGILASRIKDRYHRPVIAFADAEEGSLKGSARSIKGLHIRDALDALAKSHPGVLQKFGGHAMAAGLSIAKSQFEDFALAFDAKLRELLTAEDLEAEVQTDGELGEDELCLASAELIAGAGPWGQAFPEPQFEGNFELIQARVVGDKHLKMVISPAGNSDLACDAIAFFLDPQHWPEPGSKLRLVYRLDINEYRGSRSLQLVVSHLQSL